MKQHVIDSVMILLVDLRLSVESAERLVVDAFLSQKSSEPEWPGRAEPVQLSAQASSRRQGLGR